MTAAADRSRAPTNGAPFILLVEDDEHLCRSLSFTLRRSGHAVETALSGTEGLRKAREAHERGARFALLITDIQLPGIDGVELIAAVKAFRPDIPVLVITGLSSRELREKLAALGVSRVLSKPFGTEELAAVVEEILCAAG
jgi:DNA-binding response OmpR family regulator